MIGEITILPDIKEVLKMLHEGLTDGFVHADGTESLFLNLFNSFIKLFKLGSNISLW